MVLYSSGSRNAQFDAKKIRCESTKEGNAERALPRDKHEERARYVVGRGEERPLCAVWPPDRSCDRKEAGEEGKRAKQDV